MNDFEKYIINLGRKASTANCYAKEVVYIQKYFCISGRSFKDATELMKLYEKDSFMQKRNKSRKGIPFNALNHFIEFCKKTVRKISI